MLDLFGPLLDYTSVVFYVMYLVCLDRKVQVRVVFYVIYLVLFSVIGKIPTGNDSLCPIYSYSVLYDIDTEVVGTNELSILNRI